MQSVEFLFNMHMFSSVLNYPYFLFTLIVCLVATKISTHMPRNISMRQNSLISFYSICLMKNIAMRFFEPFWTIQSMYKYNVWLKGLWIYRPSCAYIHEIRISVFLLFEGVMFWKWLPKNIDNSNVWCKITKFDIQLSFTTRVFSNITIQKGSNV